MESTGWLTAMDIASLVGVLICFGGVFAGFSIEGGTPTQLMAISAACIVFGGAGGATMVAFPLATSINLWKVIMQCYMRPKLDPVPVIKKFVEFSEKVRREGLLVLEEDANNETDPFLRNGLQLVIDGNDTELVKDILHTDIKFVEERHHVGAAYLETMAGFTPTFGIVGTVMGLVLVLSNLSDPGSLGPMVAAAFIATLYGVGSANALFLPWASKLKNASKEEVLVREIMVEGILSIQAGDNPRIVQEKLAAFLPPKERSHVKQEG